MTNQKQLISYAHEIHAKCIEILNGKNHDYSVGDDALRNFKAATLVGMRPTDGLLIRMTDKITRIGNLLKHPAKVKDEKIEDTLMDLMNYAFLTMAVLKDEKENKTKK